MFTELELAAIALINQVEMNIRLGVPLTAALINAADNFRKKQLTSKKTDDSLNNMFKQVQQAEATVIRIKPNLKLVKDEN